MNNEQTAKEIAYNWFLGRMMGGDPITKDVFLYDRVLWDSMSTQLMEIGESPTHDDVKELVRRLDKGGYLGGIVEKRPFADQQSIVKAKADNRKETGHPDGLDGIADEIVRYSTAMDEPSLAEYYQTPHWGARSQAHREWTNWTCQLCLKNHPPNSASLVTHHRSYELKDGTKALFKETNRELMAVCFSPCHQLADIARYMRVGRITKDQLDTALSPLFACVR